LQWPLLPPGIPWLHLLGRGQHRHGARHRACAGAARQPLPPRRSQNSSPVTCRKICGPPRQPGHGSRQL